MNKCQMNKAIFFFLELKKNSNKIAEIMMLPPIITLIGGISFIKSQAHSGPKTASVSIRTPTTAAGVVWDPMVIIINPKPIWKIPARSPKIRSCDEIDNLPATKYPIKAAKIS